MKTKNLVALLIANLVINPTPLEKSNLMQRLRELNKPPTVEYPISDSSKKDHYTTYESLRAILNPKDKIYDSRKEKAFY